MLITFIVQSGLLKVEEGNINTHASHLVWPGTVLCKLGLAVVLVTEGSSGLSWSPLQLRGGRPGSLHSGQVMPSPLPEDGPHPTPLCSEADPWGQDQRSRGIKWEQRLPGPPASCLPTARLSGQRAYCPAWDLSTYRVHLRQPRQAALMDYSHYLPHCCLNIYQTIMYLVARHGEWKGQEAELLGQMQGLITDWINPLLI